MSTVIDLDEGINAFCPFSKNGICHTECMMMRPTGFGEPRCSFRVIADELVQISSTLNAMKAD